MILDVHETRRFSKLKRNQTTKQGLAHHGSNTRQPART